MQHRDNHWITGAKIDTIEAGTVLERTAAVFEMRNNLVIKILHRHGTDVSQLLQDFKRSRWILVLDNDSQDCEDLVNNLARDEAAQADVNILEEGHAQKRYSRLYGCQDITVSGQSMIPPF